MLFGKKFRVETVWKTKAQRRDNNIKMDFKEIWDRLRNDFGVK
jgi:hypothetical protein